MTRPTTAGASKSRTYAEQLAQLEPLEIFDAKAFQGDAGTPQHVCDFVLTLAVAYNDIRDLVQLQQLLSGVRPPDTTEATIANGQFGGLHVHWIRSLSGVLNELAALIQENSRATNDPAFSKVVRSLSKDFRVAWDDTVAASASTDPKGSRFGRLIYFSRNKIAYHYDAKAIGSGYRRLFLTDDARPPYISRGLNMAQTRFCFADAAVESLMMHYAGAKDGEEFVRIGWAVLSDIGHALRQIVLNFINARSPWRTPSAG